MIHMLFPFRCVCPFPPCLPGFPCFFLFSLSIYLFFFLIGRTCRWHGAWPDKVIPQYWGLPERDSLDTVSPLLARCRLQREGRPELEWGVRESQEQTDKYIYKVAKVLSETKRWNQCSNVHGVPAYSNVTLRREYFLMYFVLSFFLSTSIKS